MITSNPGHTRSPGHTRCAYCGDEKQPGLGNLYVSMAQAMGVKTDTVGVSTGGLAGLTEA